MAFGIDDTLMAAAASISLTDTMVSVIKKYKSDKVDLDIETLIEQVRCETIRRLNVADAALASFEKLLHEQDVDMGKPLIDVIRDTPFWNWSQRSTLKKVDRQISELHRSVYDAADDVAALVYCKDRTGSFGRAVVESAPRKHKFQERFLASKSLGEKINVLRSELKNLKASLLEYGDPMKGA
jgi:hypothetical protein